MRMRVQRARQVNVQHSGAQYGGPATGHKQRRMGTSTQRSTGKTHTSDHRLAGTASTCAERRSASRDLAMEKRPW